MQSQRLIIALERYIKWHNLLVSESLTKHSCRVSNELFGWRIGIPNIINFKTFFNNKFLDISKISCIFAK
uniref:Uncharacterized protein n=1 Tax=Myoviridae sp. ctPuP5 TaxID=2823543 RepID=A0A8S5L9U3_9CAUD|nr:MAG TPA: hypothetical protein [Myoviridae sp. ctPuP5]